LLDFGFVCLKSPFELLDRYEQRMGLSPGTLPWRGPFDVTNDPLWARVGSGALTERDYWQQRVSEVQAVTGTTGDLRELMRVLFEGTEDDVMRPEARALARDVAAAGLRVGILSNDLRTFHGEEWAADMTLLREVDFVLDASADHVPPKPHPGAYRRASERMDLSPAEVLFVDDQETNVRGAARVGMMTVRFDVTDVDASFDRIRSLLPGLDRQR
jgi:putative hydrolase of the HAD superfamily